MAQTNSGGGGFRFRVSDSLTVPLRGHLLRLRLVDGTPSMQDLKAGKRLRMRSPAGDDRVVTIVAHGVASGRATQHRLERTRELDVVISNDDASADGRRIDIGWFATGPVEGGAR